MKYYILIYILSQQEEILLSIAVFSWTQICGFRSAILSFLPVRTSQPGRGICWPLSQPYQAWAMGWTYLPCRYIARAYEDRGTGQDELGFVSISSIMLTPRVCSVTFRFHDNKGTTFVSLYCLSRPQTPTFFRKRTFFFHDSLRFGECTIWRVRRTKRTRRLRSTDDYSAISRRLLLATNKGRCQSNSLFLGFARPVAAKCSVGLHGGLFTFSLKLRKKSPMENTLNKPPF